MFVSAQERINVGGHSPNLVIWKLYTCLYCLIFFFPMSMCNLVIKMKLKKKIYEPQTVAEMACCPPFLVLKIEWISSQGLHRPCD